MNLYDINQYISVKKYRHTDGFMNKKKLQNYF